MISQVFGGMENLSFVGVICTFEGEDHIQIYGRTMKSSKKIGFYYFNKID